MFALPESIKFVEKQFLSVVEQLSKLKKAVGENVLLTDHLQHLLEDRNETRIFCGCKGCVGQVEGNYPRTDDNFAFGVEDMKRLWGPCDHTVKVLDSKQCKLFADFKQWCEKFNAPIPKDEDDPTNPMNGGANITECLSEWRERVAQLSYEVQVEKVYKMLHAIAMDVYHPVNRISFEEWFKLGDVSLVV